MTNDGADDDTVLHDELDELHDDQPILSKTHDMLGREALAESLARNILQAKRDTALVVGLNAPWGAGKSSLLNMLKESLEGEVNGGKDTENRDAALVIGLNALWGAGKSSLLNMFKESLEGEVNGGKDTENSEQPSEAPIIIEFNPWNYGNVDQLIRMFFSELGRGIGTDKRVRLTKKLGKGLDSLGNLVACLAPGAGNALKDEAKKLMAEKGLYEIKAELDEQLVELGRRIIVFIDDIDRLERDVVRLLFRMVRLNANFPNVTYVLAFDRKVVECHLDEPGGIRGRDYLEKIVQVSFDIPVPESDIIHRILRSEIKAILPSNAGWIPNKGRFDGLFSSRLGSSSDFMMHFQTLRHVKRYVNSLRFTLPPIASEVDVADFLFIELIRVFHPEVYQGIINNKHILVPDLRDFATNTQPKKRNEVIDDLCAKVKPEFKGSIREILVRLFPSDPESAERTSYYYDLTIRAESKPLKSRRVSSRLLFDSFFQRSVPSQDFTREEINAFIEGLGNRVKTAKALQQAFDDGKGMRLLEYLWCYCLELEPEHVGALVTAIFEIDDDLFTESNCINKVPIRKNLLTQSIYPVIDKRIHPDLWAHIRALSLILRSSLLRLESEDERLKWLLGSIKGGKSVAAAVAAASIETLNVETSSSLFERQSDWDELRDAFLARAYFGSQRGKPWQSSMWRPFFVEWLDRTPDGIIGECVAAYIGEDDEKLIDFIDQFYDYSTDITDPTITQENREIMMRMLDVRKAAKRLERYQPIDEARRSKAANLLESLEYEVFAYAKSHQWETGNRLR